MPHRAPKVCCPKCGGSGEIHLTRPLADAFHYIRNHPGCSVKDYHAHLCETPDCPTSVAAQNRMNALCEMMVVVRRKKSGRFRYYEVRQPDRQQPTA
jgi:hypothetical protein